MSPLPVVILAGGFATRLYPLSKDTPKLLIPIFGKPFIYHQFLLLKEKGINSVYLSLGYLSDQVIEYLKREPMSGIEVRLFEDGDKPLGTGGALLHILPSLPEAFLLIYGDSYLDTDYSNFSDAFLSSNKLAMMAVFKNNNRYDKSNIVFKNGEILVYDKNIRLSDMVYIDYGLLAFKKEFFRRYSLVPPFDLAVSLSGAVKDGIVGGFEVFDRFYEIGSFKGISETEEFIKRRIGHE